MSQHNHVYTKENPPHVTRNEVTLSLSPQKFGKTSPNKGQEFWALEANETNWDKVVNFIGRPIIMATTTRFLRRVGIDIFSDAKNKVDGVINWDAVLQDWAEFDTGGATLKDLMEEINQLQDQAAEITDTMEEEGVYDDNGDVKADKQERFNELSLELKDLTNKIRPLKKEIKRIQEKYAVIAEKRKATKEAKAGQEVTA
jgi:hypothetical protein